MFDINFAHIAARCGSQTASFEELCCQLAPKTLPSGTSFERFRGAGGDGGVECIANLADGSKRGWQAKYVFEIDSLIKQTDKALRTALSVHPDLTEYVVCFPFDLTGKTKRKGKSESEKFKIWARTAIAAAKKSKRRLTIETWPAHKIKSLLLEKDPSGGIRFYFFSETVLSNEWFTEHQKAATKAAGPRYTPELNVQTELVTWFSAFMGDAEWRNQFQSHYAECSAATQKFQYYLKTDKTDTALPKWPPQALKLGKKVRDQCAEFLGKCEKLVASANEQGMSTLTSGIGTCLSTLIKLENLLLCDLEHTQGEGADSEGFRQFSAAYQCSFPAANLDATRKLLQSFTALSRWLESPAGFLAFRSGFVLTGAGGSGKTHGMCDIATKRIAAGSYTCIVFGHQFNGQPDFWTRLIESLGLPVSLAKGGLLDALDAAAQASGKPLLVCIDAINETRPRDYWLHRFGPVMDEFEKHPRLKLCISCRTTFLPICVPKGVSQPIVEHKGFGGMERAACNAFFTYYGLEAPLVPEFFNGTKLWWDGKDGFRTSESGTVFRDPHVAEGGPQSLIAEAGDLGQRLKKLKHRLVWTLVGEKLIIDGTPGANPILTFSQIAHLNDDGTVTVGERSFFDDELKDQGIGEQS